jgi:amidase
MTRTVADAAILLSALAGIDPRDPSTEQSLGKSQPDYTKFLDPRGLRGARIGVVRKHFGLRAGADKIVEAAIETMISCGAIVVDPADLSTHGKFEDSEFAAMLYEFKAGLNAYLAGLGPRAPVRTLKEIIEFNERNKEKELLYFGQDTFIKAEAKGPLTEKAYLDALEKNRRLSRDEGIDAVMNEHRLDALVAPTTGPAHKIDLLYGDRDTGGSSTPAAVAGYPSITVPAGHVFGLPVGVSFFGRAYSEPTLFKLAFAFEQATKVRQPPKFLPTVG